MKIKTSIQLQDHFYITYIRRQERIPLTLVQERDNYLLLSGNTPNLKTVKVKNSLNMQKCSKSEDLMLSLLNTESRKSTLETGDLGRSRTRSEVMRSNVKALFK